MKFGRGIASPFVEIEIVGCDFDNNNKYKTGTKGETTNILRDRPSEESSISFKMDADMPMPCVSRILQLESTELSSKFGL